MNKLKFLLLICLMTFAISCGQQKRYITYKVKKGETMKDIAKRLDMKTKDLMRLNPDVKRRPVENTKIIVPDAGANLNNPNSASNNKKNTRNHQPIDGSTHTVQKKETVYSITKKYNISKETLARLNPQYSGIKNNKINTGQVLKIKDIKNTSNSTISQSNNVNEGYLTHTVAPKETIYSLTKRYSITKDELIILNPQVSEKLKNDILSLGEVLKIRSITEENIEETNLVYQDNINVGQPVKVALLIPFNASKYSHLNAKDIFRKNKVMNFITDFYLGSKIAIDSIKRQGVNLQVKVYDTGKKGANASKILSSNELNNVDAVIGPFFENQANLIAKKVDAPIVFPHFSNKQDKLFTSKKIVKSSPSSEMYITKLTKYLKKNYNGETIIIVGDGKAKSNTQVTTIVNSLKMNSSIIDITVLKPKKGYIKKTRFTDKMKPNSSCWIIMTSNDNAIVADVLNSFVVVPKKVNARIFAVSKVKAYDRINNNNLAKLGFTYVSNNFFDESNSNTKAFFKRYQSENNGKPTTYAIKGFDLTYDVIARLASGQGLKSTFNEGVSTRVGHKFNYNIKSQAPTSNRGLFIVQYKKDLSLEQVD